MSDHTITQLPTSEVKLEFTVSAQDAKPYLDEAVRELSTARPIPGFRPGKATYEEAKRAYGEMRIWETALERIVRSFYVRAVLDAKLETIGSPAINIDQLVPGQDIKFTATAPLEPKATKVADLKKCQVTVKKTEVKPNDLAGAMEELRNMRRAEALVDRPATMQDLVIIDMEMRKDKVVVDGGTGRDYRVFLGESHYIPGFAEKLEGTKAGEERVFTLNFPTEHYQKHLAGQPIEFTTTTKGVYELTAPKLDDDFAKAIGFDTLALLQAKIQENMGLEAKQKADEAAEIELLEKLVDSSTFSDVPEMLVSQEVNRMIQELQSGIDEQGMKWEDYLSSIKKTTDQLKQDFLAPAVRRIKTAVLIKHFAKEQQIEVTKEELDQEQDRLLKGIKPSDTESRLRVASPEFRDYMTVQLRNRKTLEWLKKECIQE
jgi:trigger factor